MVLAVGRVFTRIHPTGGFGGSDPRHAETSVTADGFVRTMLINIARLQFLRTPTPVVDTQKAGGSAVGVVATHVEIVGKGIYVDDAAKGEAEQQQKGIEKSSSHVVLLRESLVGRRVGEG